jgi:hypothetical protein
MDFRFAEIGVKEEKRPMARDAESDEQLARLQAQVDDLEALLAHHDVLGTISTLLAACWRCSLLKPGSR